MKIYSVIFTWLDYFHMAAEYEKIICPMVDKCSVINSNTSIQLSYPTWIHLQDAYFTEQWYTAIDLFLKSDCDILFHTQADCQFDDFSGLINKASYYFKNHNCGIYSPNIDYTAWTYDLQNLKKFDTNVYEVPQTDESVWFIHRSVIEQFPRIDPIINKYGWFVDFICIILSRQQEKVVLRDYTYVVKHSNITGYDMRVARGEFENLTILLGDVGKRMNELLHEAISAQ